jgi:hypothetical protein
MIKVARINARGKPHNFTCTVCRPATALVHALREHAGEKRKGPEREAPQSKGSWPSHTPASDKAEVRKGIAKGTEHI